MSYLLKLEPKLKFLFRQQCKTFPDVWSHNVIGEIKGSEFPDEIIVVGGHLDSWDLGDGAHDDGAGVVQSMEVLRLFKESGYRPKRTIRVVLFMNEENGLRGGNAYADSALSNREKHIFALESDAGGFTPRGFSFNCSDDGFPAPHPVPHLAVVEHVIHVAVRVVVVFGSTAVKSVFLKEKIT